MNDLARDLKKYYAYRKSIPDLILAFSFSVSVETAGDYVVGLLPSGETAAYSYGDGDSDRLENTGGSPVTVTHGYEPGSYVLNVYSRPGAFLSFNGNKVITSLLSADRDILTDNMGRTGIQHQQWLFNNCENLALDDSMWGMVRPDLRAIATSAFCNTKAAFTYIPGSVGDIYGSAFERSLVTLSELPPYLGSLGLYAFASTPVTISELPPYCWSCDDSPFMDCPGVTSMTFPVGIQFRYQPLNLTPVSAVYFKGQWTAQAATTKILRGVRNADIYLAWPQSDGFNVNEPWGATNCTFHYDWNPNA